MRVAQVSTWRTPCGIADYTGHLVAALADAGVDTDIAAIDRTLTRYLSRRELKTYFEQLAEQAAHSDLVHIQHEFSFFAGGYSAGASLGNLRRFLRLLHGWRKPTVVTFHTDPLWFVRRNHLVLDPLLQIGARTAWRAAMPTHFARQGHAGVIAHSRTTRRHLIDAGIPADAIEVLPQGVPRTAAARASRAERASARAWLGLPREAIVLSMFGFVAGYKGYGVAIEALKRLPEQYHLLVVGGRHPLNQTPDLDPVLDAVDDDEVAGRITFTGFVSPEVREACMTATDICLAPYAGYPLLSGSAAITWALASGRPVIASEIPAFREIAEQEDCLELVAPGSAGELALAVETLSVDRARQQALIDGAARFAEANSWANMAERHAELYERLTGSRSSRSRGATPSEAGAAAAPDQSLPPAPISFVRRPQFAYIELNGTGQRFWLAHDGDPRDLVTTAAVEDGIPASALWQLVRHLATSHAESLVVDLGAHVGTVALPLAALGARVLAVEASPRNVMLLRAAALRNRFELLEVVHAAISDQSESLRFCDAGPWGTWSGATRPSLTSTGRSTCPAQRLTGCSSSVDSLRWRWSRSTSRDGSWRRCVECEPC